MSVAKNYAAVSVGAVAGGGVRLAFDAILPHTATEFPWSTLIINVVGAFALASLVGGLWQRASTPDWVKAGAGPGLLGSFTTFSAVMASLVLEGAAGEWLLGASYLAATLVLGFGAAVAGLRIGIAMTERRLATDASTEERGTE